MKQGCRNEQSYENNGGCHRRMIRIEVLVLRTRTHLDTLQSGRGKPESVNSSRENELKRGKEIKRTRTWVYDNESNSSKEQNIYTPLGTQP